jgi:hypothetical protein
MDKDTIIKLELTVEEVNIVMAGLAELPVKLSLKTLQKVEEQARSQVEAPATTQV